MEVSDQIIKVLDKIAEQIGLAVDWTQENIIPYVKDLLTRYATTQIISNIVAGGIYLSLIIISVVMIIHILRQRNKSNTKSIFIMSEDGALFDEGWINVFGIIVIFISIIVLIIGIIGFPCCVNSVIGWSTVPEVQIISDLNMMMKHMG